MCFVSKVGAVITAVMVKKEVPKRPEDYIPSSSLKGDVLWTLLTSCWEHDPGKRPMAAQVAENSWYLPSQAEPEAEPEAGSVEERSGKRQRRERGHGLEVGLKGLRPVELDGLPETPVFIVLSVQSL
ncbi:hypothetical protein FRC12_007115 [Ceratobasidium sp. 428]|nr:hypothetical protein FRC12_007115 [Ceratobasidium sp. 428]